GSGMTLAAILVFSMFCAPSAQPWQDQATAPAQSPPAPSQQPSSSTPAQKSTSQGQTKTAPRYHHRKRTLPPNCNPAPARQTGSASAPADPPATASAPTNCPPPKVIVRQGGAPDPNIQLAGGTSGGQTSHERDAANLLESTEANLKKIAGRQLTPSQQDMVNQVRQFIDQSKKAVDAGDLERARTLAWKAQLLSEELVKPDK